MIFNPENSPSVWTQTQAPDVIERDESVVVNENLANVFAEIERQFDVKVSNKVPNIAGLEMTGSFEKHENAAETLALICQNFDLNFQKLNENTYLVLKK